MILNGEPASGGAWISSMFDEMIERIRNTTIAMLLKVRIEVSRPMVRPIEEPKNLTDNSQLVTNSAEGAAKPTVKSNKEVGRNDPCPCGSGKKYKNCCGKNV